MRAIVEFVMRGVMAETLDRSRPIVKTGIDDGAEDYLLSLPV